MTKLQVTRMVALHQFQNHIANRPHPQIPNPIQKNGQQMTNYGTGKLKSMKTSAKIVMKEKMARQEAKLVRKLT